MSQRYFLITGSEEICEVVEQADLMKAVHDMFCCCDVADCDNCYLEAFKEEFKDGVDFEGWKESLEDGWLNVEELPAQPKQLATLRADNKVLLEALKEARPYIRGGQEVESVLFNIDAAIAHSERQMNQERKS